MSLVNVSHSDGSNVSTVEKKTLKIYQKSTCRLSEELGASKDTIHCQINILRKSYRSSKPVTHELAHQQVQRKVDFCRQPIGNPMDDRFFKRIVTCDEKWIYYRKPDALKELLSPRQPAKVIVKKVGSVQK